MSEEVPHFSSPVEEAAYWRAKAGEWRQAARDARDELEEFQKMFSNSMKSGRGNVGEHEVSNQDVLEAGLEIGTGEILERDDDRNSVDEEGVNGLRLAVGEVDPEETLVSTVDLPPNEAASIINAVSALEVRSQFGPTEEDLITVLKVTELALHLFMFVNPEDLLKLAQTCHILRFLSEDDKLWEGKCKESNLQYCLDSAEEDLLRHRNTMNSSLQEVLARLDRKQFFQFSPWKANFLKHIRIEINFRQNPIRRPVVLKLYNSRFKCMEFVGNKIVSVSGTRRFGLKIWDPLSGICRFILEGHTEEVTTIQVDNPFIISSSLDGYLKVWNANTGECVRTMRDPTDLSDGILSTHLYKGTLVSGTAQGKLRLWKVNEGTILNFMGHHMHVRCVQYNGRLVASGCDASDVKIWNPETNECLHTCDGHRSILRVAFAGDHVVSSTVDNIRVWDVEDGTCTHTFNEYKAMGNCMEYGMVLHGNILVSGHTHSIVKIWDTRTWEGLQVLDDINKDSEVVSTFDFNDKFVVTGSRARVTHDIKMKLWDIKTGDFIRDLLVLKQGDQCEVDQIRMKDAMIACSIALGRGSKEIHLFNFDHLV